MVFPLRNETFTMETKLFNHDYKVKSLSLK